VLNWLLAWGTRLDQGDVSSAKGAFLRRINCGGGTKTTEERQVKVQIFLTAVDKHSNTNDNPPLFSYSAYRLSERASRGQDVINNKDMFARRNFKVAPEDPYLSLFFGEDTPRS